MSRINSSNNVTADALHSFDEGSVIEGFEFGVVNVRILVVNDPLFVVE